MNQKKQEILRVQEQELKCCTDKLESKNANR